MQIERRPLPVLKTPTFVAIIPSCLGYTLDVIRKAAEREPADVKVGQGKQSEQYTFRYGGDTDERLLKERLKKQIPLVVFKESTP